MGPAVFTIDYIFHWCALVLCGLQGKQQSYSSDRLPVIFPVKPTGLTGLPQITCLGNHLSATYIFCVKLAKLGAPCHLHSHSPGVTLIGAFALFFLDN